MQEYKLKITLPKNVYNLRLALVFLGEGNAYFDDVNIKLFDGDKFVKNIDVPNGNFELSAPNNTLHSWQTESEVLSAGIQSCVQPIFVKRANFHSESVQI